MLFKIAMFSQPSYPKVNLASLPLELFNQIVEAIDWKGCESDINSLTRTSRLLYDRLVRFLYHLNHRLHGRGSQARVERWAVQKPRLETLQKALSLGLIVTDDESILVWAFQNCPLPFIHLLLETPGVNVAWYAYRQGPALICAADSARFGKKGHGVPLIMKLIDNHGADVNSHDHQGWTALNVATARGDADMVELLLSRNASINKANHAHPGGLLYAAAKRGHLPIARILLAKGMDPNSSKDFRRTPMHAATHTGDFQMLDLLIKHGGNIDICVGRTPLEMAVYAGNTNVVRGLLERGVNMQVTDRNHESLLALACRRGVYEVAEILLRRGAQIDHSPPLISCAASGNGPGEKGHIQVIKLLLRHGADPNEHGPGGSTALNEALDHSRYNIARVLIQHGADIEYVDSKGMTPLLRFVYMKKRNLNTASILLEMGANPMAVKGSGLTAAHLAARYDRTGLMKLLLATPGVDINQRDYNGRTPFFHAAARGRGHVLKLLLSRGTPLSSRGDMKLGLSGNLPDIFGTMPIIAAARNGRGAAIMTLLKASPESFHVRDAHGRGILWWVGTSSNPASLAAASAIRRFVQRSDIKFDGPHFNEGSSRFAYPSERSRLPCDVCTRCSIRETTSYRCKVCDSGRFLICGQCKDEGASCRAGPGAHELVGHLSMN